MPKLSGLEQLSNPKETLYSLLRQASDLNRHRLRSFNVARSARLVSMHIEDFSPLRRLSAFAALEEEVGEAIRENGWRH